jgi:hypothetical protein
VGRAHGRQGEGTPRPRSPEHAAETPSRLRQPTAGAVLAAAHGDEPGSAINPVACPISTNPITYWGSPCTRAAPRRTHNRSGLGRSRRRRVVAAGAGLTATSTSPRPSALRAQQPKEIQVDTPC